MHNLFSKLNCDSNSFLLLLKNKDFADEGYLLTTILFKNLHSNINIVDFFSEQALF